MNMQQQTDAPLSRRRRGSAVVFMIVLLSILVTGMTATMAVVSGVQTQTSSVDLKRNAAFYAAEAGIQLACWNMNNNSSWTSSLPASGTLPNGCTYSVSILSGTWPSPVTFQSVGTSADGTVVSQASITVTSNVVVPGMAIGGNMADNGTLAIAGSVLVAGDVTRNGSMVLTNVAGLSASSLEAMGKFTTNGTFNVPGNILMNGSITSNGSVIAAEDVQSGSSITHNGTWSVPAGNTLSNDSPNLNITAPTVDTATLISEAESGGEVLASVPTVSGTPTIDFSKSANKIVYVDGNSSLNGGLKVLNGPGTLIIQGSLSVNGNIGTSGSPAQANIVTTGNVTLNGSTYLNGAFCAGGSYTKNGSLNITGVIVVQTNLLSNGSVSLTYATAPSFVHYTGSTGGGNILATNFSGATY